MNWRWVLRRIGMGLLVLWTTITITFGMIRLMPGSPIDRLRAELYRKYGATMSDAAIDRQVRLYLNVKPDEPLWQQYVDYLITALQGDLGYSYLQGAEVSTLMADVLPWTVFLLSVAITLQYVIGILLGAMMAYTEGSRFDLFSSTVSTLAVSIPFYALAFLFIFLFVFQWDVFPQGGKYAPGLEPGSLAYYRSVLYYATLPILSVVLTSFGGIALSMRANSIQTLGSDYIRGARLRGLSDFRISYRYVARNAILPLYTGLLIQIGFMFGGSVILEQIFSYRGVGYLMLDATLRRDYPVMMGAFMIITVAVVVGVFVADLTYSRLDPRIKTAGENR
ncbi:ABC transporter permease [Haladaptatus salinisoli]|uniref:ABC transporter permease n=1 Tax=Haladaptatus salinisoli TaxID=2884876 RepID=UPI001D0AC9CB|nr:ABC transporter permease [Haladaptatus salinisoli]